MAHIGRHGTQWRAQVYKAGQRRSRLFPSKREAQAWAAETETELARGAGKGPSRSFSLLCGEYLRLVTPHKKSVTWEERTIARLLAQIGANTDVAELDSARIARWRDERVQTVSGSTVQREANLLRNMLRVARDEWKWKVGDGFTGVRLPKHNPPRRAIWTWPLILRVLRAPRTGKTAEVQRAFRIALHTGLRLQEVLSHTYDAKHRVIHLADSKTGPGIVPVPRRAAKLLPAAPFTVSANEASVLFGKLCRELCIEGLTFHDARASALTWLSRRMDVLTLAKISRHRDISLLSNIYYRESAEQVAARI